MFEFAANIWEAVLQPKVDIIVAAQFTPLGANVLGSAGPRYVISDFPGEEFAGTWYHAALANHLAGEDLVPTLHDINANFSSTFAFYFGFDNNEGALVDLLPVVLHELGHGLGFSNFVNEVTGTLNGGLPDIYSQYTVDVTTGKVWNTMTDAERAASAVNVRKVSWNGVNVKKDVPKVLAFGEPFVSINGGPPLMFGTAAFGAALTAAGVTGDLVTGIDPADAAGPSTTDACSPLTNDLTGKVALVDRGTCGFVVKVKNAQNAGAIAVIVADNAVGSPPAGLGGADPTITIPSGRVTLADGNAIKAALVGPVTAKLALDMSIRAGTDRVKGLAMVAALDPVAPGSSISHWDTAGTPNQLMEPSINIDLTSSITPPQDLTASQMTDIGWFSDADDVGECAVKYANKPLHELACVVKETDRLRRAKIISTKEQAGILVCTLLTLGR